jgi:hypothetical protein
MEEQTMRSSSMTEGDDLGRNVEAVDGERRQRREPRRRLSRRSRRTCGMVVAVLVVAVGAFGSVPANAETPNGTAPSAGAAASWDCSAGWYSPNDMYVAKCQRGSDQFAAHFYPRGEHLAVIDCFPNGRHTYAYLDLLDTPHVDYTRHSGGCQGNSDSFNLSITDGTRFSLKVCSSTSSAAKCSPTLYGTA